MSSGNVDLALRFFDLLARGEIDAGLALASDDFLLDRSRSNAPWRGVTRGRTEARREYATFIEGARDVSENPTWEVTASRSLGSDLVGLATRMRVRGRASGIEVDAYGGWLARIADGRMTEAVLHQSFDDALLDGRRRLLDRAHLYFVCEARPSGSDPRPLLEAALRGGVDIVQLRDKEIDDEHLVAAARAFREAADAHDRLFFLNDRPDLVAACDADGVHVGQDDVPVAEARRIAGPAVAVGLS
ncbi:MAG: thiamine phosphate synthase, partial [Solirubrobacterales bacterium]